ncbi:hypothetical protein IBA8402_05600 [Pseudomonas syringae]
MCLETETQGNDGLFQDRPRVRYLCPYLGYVSLPAPTVQAKAPSNAYFILT